MSQKSKNVTKSVVCSVVLAAGGVSSLVQMGLVSLALIVVLMLMGFIWQGGKPPRGFLLRSAMPPLIALAAYYGFGVFEVVHLAGESSFDGGAWMKLFGEHLLLHVAVHLLIGVWLLVSSILCFVRFVSHD